MPAHGNRIGNLYAFNHAPQSALFRTCSFRFVPLKPILLGLSVSRRRRGRNSYPGRRAARATALRFRLEVHVRSWHRPRERPGFGFGQADFSKTGDFKLAKAGFDDSEWRDLNLPHDWAVELPFVHDDASNGGDSALPGTATSRSAAAIPKRAWVGTGANSRFPRATLGRRIWVEFDGAFRDVLVFVNGCFIGRNDNGYAPFRFDLTDFLAYGAKNYIVLRVDASFGDGWFYEGAGIYRHVWLTKTDARPSGQMGQHGPLDGERQLGRRWRLRRWCRTRAGKPRAPK